MLKLADDTVRVRLEIAEIEQAFDYIAEKFRSARSKIEHAAFSPEISGFALYSKSYREAVDTLIWSNRVYYRYVAGVGPDTERRSHRIHGIRKHLQQMAEGSDLDSRYSAKVVFTDASYNGLNFFVFDETELAIYVPGMEGEPGVGLFTRERADISAYLRNFAGLWHKARHVKSVDEVERIQVQLASLRPALDNMILGSPRPTHASAADLVIEACRRLPETARVLAHRPRPGKSPFEILDEYDAQDLLQATLRGYLKYSVQENPVGKVASTRSGRVDISIEELGILIELKYARSSKDQARILSELSEDLVLYSNWPHLRTLVFLIYNSHQLRDPTALEKLSGTHERPGARFIVEVILA